ncbi:MAG: ornithine cyclodeaminase family protein [Kordiimonadaceae bacterium]|nr:ornithine cyclodeaminase family protein [Kordiimonadaceae bacterium]
MKIISLAEIEVLLPDLDLMPAIEQGFIDYSDGKCIVPPVGELIMDKGEVHIKYGCIKGDDFYVIKIASGFYGNPKIGLPTSNGMMILFSQNTGEVVAVLHDECILTDIRTAIAGAISAKYLAPKIVNAIGIVGTGVQARMQADYLKPVTDCRTIIVWGRDPEKLLSYKKDMTAAGFKVFTTSDMAELCENANLIVTTTPSHEPLISAEMIRPGTHITAMGSDTVEKQELDPAILTRADMVVSDSIDQSQTRGEIHKARIAGKITDAELKELGTIIADGVGRTSEDQITIADLTGVAVQDIKIAEAVYLASISA